MLIVALIALWVAIAIALAVVLGRTLTAADEGDRWRHGHREVRDLREREPVGSSAGPHRDAA